MNGEIVGFIPDEVLRYLIMALAAMSVFLLAQVFVWLRAQVSLLREKIGRENWDMLYGMILVLVKAAEQMGLRDKLLQDGAKKKEWVMARLQEILIGWGVDIDKATLDRLSDMIESAVWEEFNRYKEAHPGAFDIVAGTD